MKPPSVNCCLTPFPEPFLEPCQYLTSRLKVSQLTAKLHRCKWANVAFALACCFLGQGWGVSETILGWLHPASCWTALCSAVKPVLTSAPIKRIQMQPPAVNQSTHPGLSSRRVINFHPKTGGEVNLFNERINNLFFCSVCVLAFY